MTRQRLAEALLRVYPAAWRREYGEELFDILISRPLTWRVAADVLGAGLRQRIRAAEPATVLGVATVAVLLATTGADGSRLPHAGDGDAAADGHDLPDRRRVVHGVAGVSLAADRLWLVDGEPPPRLTRRSVAARPRCGCRSSAGSRCWSPECCSPLTPSPRPRSAWETCPPMSLAVIVAPLARLPEAWLYGSMGACGHSAQPQSIAQDARDNSQRPTPKVSPLGIGRWRLGTPRGAQAFFECSEKCAPWGSTALRMRSPPGTSIGPLATCPPFAVMRCTAASTSGTRK